MFLPRAKYQALQDELLRKEQQLTDLRATLQDNAITIRSLERQIELQKKEIQTLNTSLDATASALEQTKSTLAVSEQARKQLLKERRR